MLNVYRIILFFMCACSVSLNAKEFQTYKDYCRIAANQDGLLLMFPQEKIAPMYFEGDSCRNQCEEFWFGNWDESKTRPCVPVPFCYELTPNCCLFFVAKNEEMPAPSMPVDNYEKMTKEKFVPTFREGLLNNCALPCTHWYSYEDAKTDEILSVIKRHESFADCPAALERCNAKRISITAFPAFKRIGMWDVSSSYNLYIHTKYDRCYGVEFWRDGRNLVLLMFVADGECGGIDPYIDRISRFVRFE